MTEAASASAPASAALPTAAEQEALRKKLGIRGSGDAEQASALATLETPNWETTMLGKIFVEEHFALPETLHNPRCTCSTSCVNPVVCQSTMQSESRS